MVTAVSRWTGPASTQYINQSPTLTMTGPRDTGAETVVLNAGSGQGSAGRAPVDRMLAAIRKQGYSALNHLESTLHEIREYDWIRTQGGWRVWHLMSATGLTSVRVTLPLFITCHK